jgi:TM2 domain-containing membrane protein YozV
VHQILLKGEKMAEDLKKLEGKNWVATMILCWVFGGLGGHRFYTRKTSTAWAMLVLTLLGITAPISVIWAIVDGFTIALGHFKAEDGSELYERINWLGYTYIVAIILAIIGFILYGAIIIATIAAFAGAGTPPPPMMP